MINIDRLCAEIGFSIPSEQFDKSKQENAIRKALSILSQEGIFAYTIYLESKGGSIKWDNKRKSKTSIDDEEKIHRLMLFYSAKLLSKLRRLNFPEDFFSSENVKLLLNGKNDSNNPDPIWINLKETFRAKLTEENGILENIPQMFFVKQILEQMLTYALYRARSLR